MQNHAQTVGDEGAQRGGVQDGAGTMTLGAETDIGGEVDLYP